MLTLQRIITLSRPRFWLYIAGPFLLGYTLTISQLSDFAAWQFWLGLLWFLLPANIFLYGINDLFDADTDQFNAKKQHQEQLLSLQLHRATKVVLILCVVSVIPLLLSWPLAASAMTLLFLLLSYGYSAPPTRFKSHAGWDSYSNVLYITPALTGYLLGSSLTTQPLVMNTTLFAGVIAAASWAVAMHAFSAIPDIVPDHQAGLSTIAISLGRTGTLLFTAGHWLLATLLTALFISPIGWIGLIYVILPIWLITRPVGTEAKVYWWFPMINAVVGGILFWTAVIIRIWQ